MKISESFRYEEIQGFKFGSQPLGKPKMFSHVYFVDGLLIDTGHSRMRGEVVKRLSGLPVNQLLVTHHHEDHTGNLATLQEQFKCPGYASSLCIELMKDPPGISFAQWLVWGDYQANHQLKPVGIHLETENYQFKVISIPGHAIDMIGLYEASRGWFFSADLFVSEYIRYFKRDEDMGRQIETIREVLKLDFEALLCSHNPQFQDGKEKLRRKLMFLEDFYGRVKEFHAQGLSADQILKAMNLKEKVLLKLVSGGELSTGNMIDSVIRHSLELRTA